MTQVPDMGVTNAAAQVGTGWFAHLLPNAQPSDLPVLAEPLALLKARLADDRTSRDAFGEALMLDPAIALRVLAAANGVTQRRLRNEVATLGDTVSMLGTERLRRLVADAPLVETALSGVRLPAYRRVCAQAVLASRLATDWAAQGRDLSPAEVGLAALLYPLGELFLLAHGDLRIGRYLRLLEQCPQAPQECEYVTLGESLEALGQTLAIQWQLSELVRESMRASNALHPRALLVMLAVLVARQAFSGQPHPLPVRVLSLLAGALGLMPGELSNRIGAAVHDFNALARYYGQSPLAPFIPFAPRDAESPAAASEETTPFCLAPRINDAAACLTALDRADPPDRAWVVATLLRGLRHGLGLNRVVFAAWRRRARTLVAEATLGTDFEPLFNRFSLSLDEPEDLFARILERPEAFWLNDDNRDRAWPRVPERLRELIRVPAFFAMPLRVGGQPIGLVYADRRSPGCRLDARAFAGFGRLVAAAGHCLERLEGADRRV